MREMALCLAVVWLLSGCATRETITRVDTVRVPYALVDSASLYRVDTVWQAGSERWNVRIDTLWKRVVLRVKDTVTVTYTDTVQVIKEKDPTFWNAYKVWLPVAGFCVILGMVLLILGRRLL